MPTVPLGESIVSEGKGEYMHFQGHVLTPSSEPIPGAVSETWETDDKGEQHLISSVSSLLAFNRHTFFLSPKGCYETNAINKPKDLVMSYLAMFFFARKFMQTRTYSKSEVGVSIEGPWLLA